MTIGKIEIQNPIRKKIKTIRIGKGLFIGVFIGIKLKIQEKKKLGE